MVNYIIGVLFLILFVVYLYTFGISIVKSNKSFSYCFLYGYFVYSFFVCGIGLLIQILKLPYLLFFIYMIVLLILTILFSIIRIKKNNLVLFERGLIKFIKENWMSFFLVTILTILSLSNIEYFWMGNNLDDGFYLNRVATYASIGDIYKMTPATGLPDYSFLSVYSLNSWEIEASFFVRILHIDPSIFLRFVLSCFNYYLIYHAIICFIELIFKENELDKKHINFFPFILMLFIIIPNYLSKIIFLQDSWTFTSAMYYGSSIVKTGGIILLLIPLLKNKEINIKSIIEYFVVSVVLISKSTIAIPIIFAVFVSYLLIYLIFSMKKKNIIFAIIIFLLLLLVGILLKDIKVINKTVIEHIILNKKSIILYLAIIIIAISNFIIKNKNVKIVSLVLLVIGLFIYLNPFNDIIETLSQFPFVEARMQACLLQTIIIFAFICLFFLFFKIIKSNLIITVVECFFFIVMMFLSLYGFYIHHGNILNSYKIIYKNKMIIPNGTVNLGNSLEKLYNDEKIEINAMVPEGVDSGDGYTHSLAVLLRTYAPHSKIITATGRYGVKPGNEFSSYFQTYTKDYYNYMTDPTNEEYKQKFKELLETYPINVIVTPNKDISENIKDYDFELYDKPCDDYGRYCYYVYYKDK